MTIERIDYFSAGERRPGATRLNEIVDSVNEVSTQLKASVSVAADVDSRPVFDLEIKTLNASTLTCVRIGEDANPSAREFTVHIPPIFTETSRGTTTFVYTNINERVASGPAGPDETHKLTPPYVVGERIAVRLDKDDAFRTEPDGRMWGVDST